MATVAGNVASSGGVGYGVGYYNPAPPGMYGSGAAAAPQLPAAFQGMSLGAYGTPGALGSLSTSSQQSRNGIDYSALPTLDKYFGEGLGYVNNLSGQGQQMLDQRLGAINGYYGQASDLAAQLGQSQRNILNRDYDAYANSVGSQTAATGLYNSTIGDTMRMSVNRDRAQGLLAIDDAIAQQRLGLYTQQAGAVDGAYAGQLGYLGQVGGLGASLYSSRLSNLPTTSTSTSTSASMGR